MVFDKVKDAMLNKMLDSWEENAAKTRLKYYDHWANLCGVTEWKDIDFDNPYVHLEWILCDPRVLFKLTGGAREEALAMMDEQQR